MKTKTVDGMKYEIAGKTKMSRKAANLSGAKELHSLTLIWLLVSRHKVGLLAIGNLILVANYIFPAWPTFIGSIF